MRKWVYILAVYGLIQFLDPTSAFAQMNMIDVPNAEVVEKRNLFFQQEVNVGNRNIRTSTTLTWGMSNNFEAGFNVYHITFNTRPHSHLISIEPQQPEINPNLMINVKKGFELNSWNAFSIGTQTGVNVARHREEVRPVTFTYSNYQISVPETNHSLVLGGYYANPNYAGEGNTWGYMTGVEVEIWKDKLSIVGDMISGTNSLSAINGGVEIVLPKKWKVDLAAQFPTPQSNGHHGLVIQFIRN